MSILEPRNTVNDFVIDRLMEWGVDHIFGFPGDGIGAFDGALERADEEDLPLKYIRPTHEEICALMATAYAKWSGKIGVCAATSSPGAFHMLNGLYDVNMDNQPVVAIVGQQTLETLGSGYQQENNLERTFSDVAAYVQTIVTPSHISLKFARNTAEALIKGDPNEMGVIAESFKAVVTENVAKVKDALHLESHDENDK